MEAPKVNLLENPRQGANLLSALTFWWSIDMFRLGSKRPLGVEDLYRPLDRDMASELGDRLERKWNQQRKGSERKNPKTKPSLVKALFHTFWRDWVLLTIVTVFGEIVLRIVQPILLGRVLLYFRRQSDITREQAIYYAVAMIAAKAASIVMENQYSILTCLTGFRNKIALCSLVYRKSLRLSHSALGETSPGKVVNLMSNDIARFEMAALMVSYLWSSPVLAIVVLVLLYYEVGWAGPLGMVVVFLATPLQSLLGKTVSKLRMQTAFKTDERVRLMDEIISGINVIKLYAWEKPFAKLISEARRAELRIVLKSGLIWGLFMTFQLFTSRAALCATMVALILTGEELTASKVFVVSSYLTIVSQTFSWLFVRAVAEVSEVLVGIHRFQHFLEHDEVSEAYRNETSKIDDEQIARSATSSELALALRNVNARWSSLKNTALTSHPTLQTINLDVKKGKLVGIVGPVGAGKTSVLQAILRELPIESGSIECEGTISYVSQEPWLFAGTIRHNVLFGLPMDAKRYRTVLKVCALDVDLEQFSNGDEELIGERGISLSGGQKARVCLARAIYKKSDIYLLDDPLSAVDAHVARHLYDLCIGDDGYLGKLGATRILVTHQVHFLVESDWIIIMDEGRVAHQGTPHDLIQKGILNLHEVEHDQEESCSVASSSYDTDSSSNSSSKNNEKLEEENAKQLDRAFEKTGNDTPSRILFMNYLAGVESWIILAILAILFVLTQAIVSFADYWVGFWLSQEDRRTFLANSNATIDDSENVPLSTDICLYVQCAAIASIFLIALTRSFSFYKACNKAAQAIHDWTFRGLISSAKYFFDTNPSGRILNRFAKDMGSMDELLPRSVLYAIQANLTIIGSMVVILIVQPYFIVPIVVLSIVLFSTRKIYMSTSKSTRRLEGITRSPIFTHIATTLTGLPTIRSFKVQKLLMEEFDQHQNVNTGAGFMFHCGRIAFGLVLDALFFLLLAVVTFTFLLIETDSLGDKVGLVITQIMGLAGVLQLGVRQSAEMFNHLIAVERLLEYKNLPAEVQPVKDSEELKRKEKWPTSGQIQFSSVNFCYHVKSPLVLRNLSFKVKPSEKVGIVGRTGAGKSSIIGALFRTAIVEGRIAIDGVDTGTITLETLRSNISIIPQDPVLFSGTLRKNLDPFEIYSDAELWAALEMVELKDIASGPQGLQCRINNGGSNLSVGQRQLVCLARAILRNNRILVLDEATANVDPDTDNLIQRTIRERFVECTVLTIAHRLNTIMDYDRILVMSEGQAVEYGTPAELLRIPQGVFKDIVLATGSLEAENLMNMVK
ncbi:ATP-binding cassette sub-family C member 4-like isoform X1 [Uranotaenia lowii]|uniref:ATP-binding cassette sub-family C member 4-like isoform X1 n=2 Tax=Uranotaenia lowii TaxID=190385 RepID=UPI00247AAB25|nr:ATP-binding cassette sub-family C member 4-like isoform X1 [Uranotaenia lowii]